MIDNRSEHKNYPLPHPENIAKQDVERIAEAFLNVDRDVFELETNINRNFESLRDVSETSIKIPAELKGVFDNELKDLAPNKYIKINAAGDGFETIERTGAAGGKKGQILAKNSEKDYDFSWLDAEDFYKRQSTLYVSNESCESFPNQTVFFCEQVEVDNNSEKPRPSLKKIQILNDILSDLNTTYIIKDEIENQDEEVLDIASKRSFGRVKIGDGINVENGIISVGELPKASSLEYGVVRIGDGIDVEDGVISAPELVHADYENFGTVKPSDEDFYFSEDGSLSLKEIKYKDAIIYQNANVKIVENGEIIIDPEYAIYRAFINSDATFSFDFSHLTESKDIAFGLEIISDSEVKIDFAYDIDWQRPCGGNIFGKLKIRFEKYFGIDKFYGDMTFFENKISKDLTNYVVEDIQKDCICSTNGMNACASELLSNTNGYWNIGFTSTTNEGIFQTDFLCSTYITSLFFRRGSETGIPQYFFIEGSVDGKNWLILYGVENILPENGHLYLTQRGFFKHYRIRTTKGVTMNWARWYGLQIQDNSFEIQKVIPQLNADSLNGFSITSSGKNAGELFNLTNTNISSYANFNTRDSNNEYWIKYELPESKVVNFIDLAVPKDSPERFPLWFKIEASNDNINWQIIFEKLFLTQRSSGESFQFSIQNTTSYKYYKFTPIELTGFEFRIARFRLYYKFEVLKTNLSIKNKEALCQ